jgi:photosystem II stability/assembly factor-like uncharacterized protein
VFISYRRDDSAAICGRMYDRLVAAYGRDAIFKDVDSIPLGTDFEQYIGSIIQQSVAQVVVIGARWLNITDANGHRRLDNPRDVVRLEIESALRRGLPVIPVLVNGAVMPPPDQLPPSLQQLAWLPGIPIRLDPDFDGDMQRLITTLAQWLRARQPPSAQPHAAQVGPWPVTTPTSYGAPPAYTQGAAPIGAYPSQAGAYGVAVYPSSGYSQAAYQQTPVAPYAPGPLAPHASAASKRSKRGLWIAMSIVAVLALLIGGGSLAFLFAASQATPYAGTESFTDIIATQSGQCWAVGSNGTIIHTQNGVWYQDQSPTHEFLESIAMSQDGKLGWAVGDNGVIVGYANGKWTLYPTVTSIRLLSVSILPDGSEGWAVGTDTGGQAIILRYHNGAWTIRDQQASDIFLRAVVAISPSDAWIGGVSLFHFNGKEWSIYADEASVSHMAALSASDIWGAGFSGVLHYDGSVWRVAPSSGPKDAVLNGIAMASPSEGWAVGDTGIILHYTSGNWVAYANPSSGPDLNAVAMVSATDGWIVGSNGLIMRYQHGAWTTYNKSQS